MATRVQPLRHPLRRGLRVIEGSGVRTVRLRWKQAAFLVLAVLMFFALIYSRVHLDRAAFELSEIQTQIEQQEMVMQQLQLQKAEMEAPHRIYAEALRMGMVLPSEVRTVRAEVPAAGEGRVAAGTGADLILGSMGASR